MLDAYTRARALRRDYRHAFATPEGRRVLADLHRFCLEANPTADPHEAVFAMGMQRVFRRIAAMMRLDTEALLKLAQTEDEGSDE